MEEPYDRYLRARFTHGLEYKDGNWASTAQACYACRVAHHRRRLAERTCGECHRPFCRWHANLCDWKDDEAPLLCWKCEYYRFSHGPEREPAEDPVVYGPADVSHEARAYGRSRLADSPDPPVWLALVGLLIITAVAAVVITGTSIAVVHIVRFIGAALFGDAST